MIWRIMQVDEGVKGFLVWIILISYDSQIQ